jgi:hypothetical protein
VSARASLREWAKRLALATAAFLFTTGVLEAALRLLGYEAAADVASEPSLFWRHDDLLGWSNEPGATGTFVGPRPYPVEFRTEVSINSLGLRGPELEPLPPGGLRVLILGDSLVAGFEVKHEESFVALTQKRLARLLERPVQVINAGVRGYGTDQSLLYFRERGRKLEPRLVVYMQSNNDADDNMTLHRMRRPFGKPAFSLQSDGTLEPVGTPVPGYEACSSFGLDADFTPARLDGAFGRGFCAVQMRLADHSALFTFAVLQIARSPVLSKLLRSVASPGVLASYDARQLQRAGFLPLALPSPQDPQRRVEAGFRLTTELIRQLAKEVRASNAEFVWIAARDRIERIDRKSLAADGIVPTFLEPRSGPDLPIYFKNDSHLNWRGHELASQLLAPMLAERARALFASDAES